MGLTDLVPPFHGEFHQQLLGICADEDEWGGRLITGIGELWRQEGQTKGKMSLTSPQPCWVQNVLNPHEAQHL